MQVLPHVVVLPDRIVDIAGLPDRSFAVTTSKGVYAVGEDLVVGAQIAENGSSVVPLSDGRIAVKGSTMRVGAPGALESIELGDYQRELFVTADGFVAVGSDRIAIDKAGARTTIRTGDRYIYVTVVGDRIVITDKTGMQIVDASGRELARSGEAYLTGAAIPIGDVFVVPELRSLFVFDASAQKLGERTIDNVTVHWFAGGVIVAPKPRYSDEDERTELQLLELDGALLRDRWSVDAPRTKSVTVIGDHLVLSIEDGVWIVDVKGNVLAKIDGLGYVNGTAAFEDGIAITGSRSMWWRPSGTTELAYDGVLGVARTVPAGLATAEGEVLQIWRTDVQGPEPVPLTTDLPMNVPIVVDGRPMIIEGTKRFTLQARIAGTVHYRSPKYTAWRHLTTRDEAIAILERLVGRAFDRPLPPTVEGALFEQADALAQLPLEQTVDLVGRTLFSPASLDADAVELGSVLRPRFLDELALALDTSARLLLAAVRARKMKLEPPRRVPKSYDYLGSFTTSGSLTAADPCYLAKKSAGGFSFTKKLAVVEGLWHAFVRDSDKEPGRNAEIVAVHEDAFGVFASDEAGTVAVDAGLAGVFDKACPKPNLDLGLEDGTVSGRGAVASSGYGDGMYPVFVGKQAGKVAKVRIVFIDDKPEIDRLVEVPAAGTGKPYSASARFALGDTIEHIKFGMGSVIRVGGDNKIDVRFADGVRTLVHAKK